MTQTVGFIGSGNIGGTVARLAVAAGFDVVMSNSRGPETLAGLAKETGAKPVTVEEAARAGDVVIVSIPLKSIPRLPAGLFKGVAKDVVVVGVGDRLELWDKATWNDHRPTLLSGVAEVTARVDDAA